MTVLYGQRHTVDATQQEISRSQRTQGRASTFLPRSRSALQTTAERADDASRRTRPMLRFCFLLVSARALQAPPHARRATHLRAAEAALAVDAADAFDQFGVAAVAASAKLASQDPAGEKPSDAQTRGVVLATAAAGAVAVLAAAPKTARASIAEPVQPAVASGIPNKLARQLLQIERLNVDSNGSGDRRTHKPRLDISGNSAKVCIDGYAPEGSDRVQFIWLKNEEADAIVAACVEINQCVGCT